MDERDQKALDDIEKHGCHVINVIFDVTFIEVDQKHYKEYLGWGLWLNNGDNFKMLQLVWPTTDGVWPWNSEKSDFYQWAQPILNENGVLSKI